MTDFQKAFVLIVDNFRDEFYAVFNIPGEHKNCICFTDTGSVGLDEITDKP